MAVTAKTLPIVKIIISNKIAEQRMDFVYLGSHISPFEHRKDIDRNLMKCNKLNGILRRNSGKQMRKDIQIRFHNVISKPALLCGRECWTVRQKDRNRIISSQMKFVRSLTGVKATERATVPKLPMERRRRRRRREEGVPLLFHTVRTRAAFVTLSDELFYSL
jgi:hypothetical protein